MARKGEIIWHCYKRKDFDVPADSDPFEILAREHHMALRADGKVVEKVVTEHNDLFDRAGHVERHDYGWKLSTRKVKAAATSATGARALLEPLGYVFK